MSNALTLRDNLAPTNFDQLKDFASMVGNTGMVPQAYRGKPAEIVAAVIYGSDLGFTPMQSLQNIAVVNGKPSVYGDGLRALILSKPDCEGIEDGYSGEGEEYHAWVTVHRRGKKPVTRRFSVADARKAQLLDKPGPWKQYRDRMLLMRAQGFAIRDAYADALRGVITYEEAADYRGPDTAKDITPTTSRSDNWTHPSVAAPPADESQAPYAPDAEPDLIRLADKNSKIVVAEPDELPMKWAELLGECMSLDELSALAKANEAGSKAKMIAKLGKDAAEAYMNRRSVLGGSKPTPLLPATVEARLRDAADRDAANATLDDPEVLACLRGELEPAERDGLIEALNQHYGDGAAVLDETIAVAREQGKGAA